VKRHRPRMEIEVCLVGVPGGAWASLHCGEGCRIAPPSGSKNFLGPLSRGEPFYPEELSFRSGADQNSKMRMPEFTNAIRTKNAPSAARLPGGKGLWKRPFRQHYSRIFTTLRVFGWTITRSWLT
jgi:hypothetical protein